MCNEYIYIGRSLRLCVPLIYIEGACNESIVKDGTNFPVDAATSPKLNDM